MKKLTTEMKAKWISKVAKAVLRDMAADVEESLLMDVPMIPDCYRNSDSEAVDMAALKLVRALLREAARAA